jgi:hypothetical protein
MTGESLSSAGRENIFLLQDKDENLTFVGQEGTSYCPGTKRTLLLLGRRTGLFVLLQNRDKYSTYV